MLKTKSETRWVIVGHCGAYVGAELTRSEAIRKHCNAYYVSPLTESELKQDWASRRKRGDRAVKAKLTWNPTTPNKGPR